MIPPVLIRTVPADTTPEVEGWWDKAKALHARWQWCTYRDPIDPAGFPRTAPHWARCSSGAQRAGLVRLEALLCHGGIYIDSDVELYRPLEPLRHLRAFAAWEDPGVIPDAVIGAEPHHRAIADALEVAIARIDEGPWESGPGATTAVFAGRPDVLVLPPATFYPYHYTEKAERRSEAHHAMPWCFGAHHWAGSWLSA